MIVYLIRQINNENKCKNDSQINLNKYHWKLPRKSNKPFIALGGFVLLLNEAANISP